jgi:heat shock protein HslJ
MAFGREKIGGHAGCRGYRGTYEASGDGIRFPLLETTETDAVGSEPLRMQ